MKILRKIITLSLAVILIGLGVIAYNNNKNSEAIVRAFGPLNVTFPSVPMFNESNWFPGKSITKSITIENTDLFARNVGIRANNFHDTGVPGLSHGLSIIISNGGNIIYGEGSPTGPKSLMNFYSEPVVWLALLPLGNIAVFDFTVNMDIQSGNEFQGSSTTFDLFAGVDNEDSPFPTFGPLPTLPTLRKLPNLPTLPPLPTLKKLPTLRPLPTLPKII